MEKKTKKKIGEILSYEIEGTKIPMHFIDEALLKQKMLNDKKLLSDKHENGKAILQNLVQ